jgi:hypothetical protein
VGLTGNYWRALKTAAVAGQKQDWRPYNPYFGNPNYVSPIVPGSIVPASPAFKKKDLKTVWALIRPNVRLTTQGAMFFNIYTLDTVSPPATGLFTSRFDYSAAVNALPVSTGTQTLEVGFTYLIFCVDYPKLIANPATTTTITACNGQFASQGTNKMLRDPIDLHTDVPHVPFGFVAYTNPGGASDPSTVQVSAISLSTTSSSLTGGLDVDVLAIGWSADDGLGGTANYEYNMQFA